MSTSRDTNERVKWIQNPELLEFIKAYFMDERPSVRISLISSDRDITWLAFPKQDGERPILVDTPLEFFLNAQVHPTQDSEMLVEQICVTLSDLCRSWRLGVENPIHYITFRSPHKVLLAPSGTIQLTILASFYTETLGRELYLKAS